MQSCAPSLRVAAPATKHGSKRPLDLTFELDGTISPVSQPHLCLGCEFAMLPTAAAVQQVAQQVVPIVTAVPIVATGVPLSSTPVTGSSSSTPTLGQMVDIFKYHLSIESSMNVKDTVDEACRQLGTSEKGNNLVQRATEAWQALGSPPPMGRPVA